MTATSAGPDRPSPASRCRARSSSGTLPTGHSALGTSSVSGRRRRPSPAARITAADRGHAAAPPGSPRTGRSRSSASRCASLVSGWQVVDRDTRRPRAPRRRPPQRRWWTRAPGRSNTMSTHAPGVHDGVRHGRARGRPGRARCRTPRQLAGRARPPAARRARAGRPAAPSRTPGRLAQQQQAPGLGRLRIADQGDRADEVLRCITRRDQARRNGPRHAVERPGTRSRAPAWDIVTPVQASRVLSWAQSGGRPARSAARPPASAVERASATATSSVSRSG